MKSSILQKVVIVSVLVVVVALMLILRGTGKSISPNLLRAVDAVSKRSLLAPSEKWEVLSAVFGTQMAHTFGEKETFEYARTDPVDSSDGYRVRCAGYSEVHDGTFFTFPSLSCLSEQPPFHPLTLTISLTTSIMALD